MSDLEFNEQKGKHVGEAFTEGETIDGGGPYAFDPDKDLRDLVPDAHTDGGVTFRSAESGQFVTEEEAAAHPDTTVAEKRPGLITESLGVNPKGSSQKLNKRSVLMNLSENQHDASNYAWFVRIDEETGEPMDGFNMPIALWDDFGQPETITVVVYPRDMLN